MINKESVLDYIQQGESTISLDVKYTRILVVSIDLKSDYPH